LDQLSTSKHTDKTLLARDQFLNLSNTLLDLNFKRSNHKKFDRFDEIINWLKELKDVPSMETKLILKTKFEKDKSLDLSPLKISIEE